MENVTTNRYAGTLGYGVNSLICKKKKKYLYKKAPMCFSILVKMVTFESQRTESPAKLYVVQE